MLLVVPLKRDAVAGDDQRLERVDDLGGLGRTHPALGLLMTLFLFSLIGLPLTAGFAGKYFLFFGALAAPRERRRYSC
ncbi:MAG: proton-conducting transporter membrane subunit [Gemmatimonadaceae bacterium]